MVVDRAGNRALFVSNDKYLDESSGEGGVKLCTREFIELVGSKFDLRLFPVGLRNSFLYRLKKRSGLIAYEDYNVAQYEKELKNVIEKNEVKYVFLNLTNTLAFSKSIKQWFPSVKIILCSHGNESGDFLHEIVLHKNVQGIKKIVSRYILGKMLFIESVYRQYIDLVLTVSDIELNIEKWLGVKNVYMTPRVLAGSFIEHHPVNGRVGFFADLSHAPNIYGIKQVCKELKKTGDRNIQVRLVGDYKPAGESLRKEFPFISYLGYLPEAELQKEVATWAFSLNPVFYYSRGVSTKLGKSLAMGLPVITTKKGMRGYRWNVGEILNCDTPKEMAELIIEHACNPESSDFYRGEILKMQATSPTYAEMINDIQIILENDK